jgi:hypothetical protein
MKLHCLSACDEIVIANASVACSICTPCRIRLGHPCLQSREVAMNGFKTKLGRGGLHFTFRRCALTAQAAQPGLNEAFDGCGFLQITPSTCSRPPIFDIRLRVAPCGSEFSLCTRDQRASTSLPAQSAARSGDDGDSGPSQGVAICPHLTHSTSSNVH